MTRRPRGALRFKPSLRAQREQNAAWMQFYASAAPEHKRDAAVARADAQAAAIPPKRAYTKAAPEELEAATLAAVGQLLAVHPRVLFAVRQNGGAMQYEGAAGRPVPVWFYRIFRHPESVRVRVSDYWGFLTDKRPFAIECKRASWRKPSGTREESQAAFLGMVRALGGIGIFATSADQVAAALDSA